MLGKEKCKALKEIRKQIAENNDIEYAVSECTHQGDCKGTCPKCEAELRHLEQELEKRARLGKKVVVAGLSVVTAIGMTGCKSDKNYAMSGDVTAATTEELSGDVEIAPPETDLAGATSLNDGDGSTESTTEVELDGDVACPIDVEIPQDGTLSK